MGYGRLKFYVKRNVYDESKMIKVSRLILSVFVCLLTGFLGSFATRDSVTTWYPQLSRPSFTPPDWTFGVVWPTLYVMMGISVFLIWNAGIDKRRVKVALACFAVQLFLNGLWTFIFFGWHLIGWALVEIIFLWAAILMTIITFWKISKPAAVLLLPYILWVSFAIVLNAGLFLLNK
jgi:benzodiazapine receptor